MSDGEPSLLGHMIGHIFSMPSWHKLVLAVSMLFAGGGTLGTSLDYLTRDSTQTTTQPTASVQTSDSRQQPPDNRPLARCVSPWAMKVGLACLGGFIIGFIFRLFIKIMTLLTLMVMAILLALSYFNVMNIDFTSVEKQYESGAAWVTDQAGRMANQLMTHLPSSGSSFLGMFMGFRRKKIT